MVRVVFAFVYSEWNPSATGALLKAVGRYPRRVFPVFVFLLHRNSGCRFLCRVERKQSLFNEFLRFGRGLLPAAGGPHSRVFRRGGFAAQRAQSEEV